MHKSAASLGPREARRWDPALEEALPRHSPRPSAGLLERLLRAHSRSLLSCRRTRLRRAFTQRQDSPAGQVTTELAGRRHVRGSNVGAAVIRVEESSDAEGQDAVHPNGQGEAPQRPTAGGENHLEQPAQVRLLADPRRPSRSGYTENASYLKFSSFFIVSFLRTSYRVFRWMQYIF